jgi:hypothetical protein
VRQMSGGWPAAIIAWNFAASTSSNSILMFGCVSSKSLTDGVPALPACFVSSWLMSTTVVAARRRRGIALASSGPKSEPTARVPAVPAAP